MATAITQYTAVKPLNAYLTMTKPKSVLPHMITASAAMFIAVGGMPPVFILIITLLGGGLVAAAAYTFNSYFDWYIDASMLRTPRRPFFSGFVNSKRALVLGIGLGVTGIIILSLASILAVCLAILALGYYLLPYALFLKRRTFWGVVIGSGIGAIPPFIGWIVASGYIGITPLLLSAIIILWTLPHFWTLAIFRRNDDTGAGLKILSGKGIDVLVFSCALLLVITSLLLIPVTGLSIVYTGTACILAARFLILAWQMRGDKRLKTIEHLYNYSTFYITILFVSMILDRLVF